MEIQNKKTDNKTTLKTLKLEQKLYLEEKNIQTPFKFVRFEEKKKIKGNSGKERGCNSSCFRKFSSDEHFGSQSETRIFFALNLSIQ